MDDTTEEVDKRAPGSDALVEQLGRHPTPDAVQAPGPERVEAAFQHFIDELIADVMLNG